MTSLYYTAPPPDIFDDLKRCAIALWSTYDDTYGYATGKIGQIKDLANVRDNWMHIVAMFDAQNRNKLYVLVQHETLGRIIVATAQAENE